MIDSNEQSETRTNQRNKIAQSKTFWFDTATQGNGEKNQNLMDLGERFRLKRRRLVAILVPQRNQRFTEPIN